MSSFIFGESWGSRSIKKTVDENYRCNQSNVSVLKYVLPCFISMKLSKEYFLFNSTFLLASTEISKGFPTKVASMGTENLAIFDVWQADDIKQ